MAERTIFRCCTSNASVDGIYARKVAIIAFENLYLAVAVIADRKSQRSKSDPLRE